MGGRGGNDLVVPPLPLPPLAEPVLLPERPVSQPAARLPAVKVTLPAAMYYTGVHSQAEYNIALEGRFEAGACKRREVRKGGGRGGGDEISAAARSWSQGGHVGTKGTKTDFCIRIFVLFICPCYARLVRPDVSGCRRYREEPTVIGPLPMSRQPSRMSHDIPDGHMKGKIAPWARK